MEVTVDHIDRGSVLDPVGDLACDRTEQGHGVASGQEFHAVERTTERAAHRELVEPVPWELVAEVAHRTPEGVVHGCGDVHVPRWRGRFVSDAHPTGGATNQRARPCR